MSANPKTLQALGSYWVSKGGVNLGVVGNYLHCQGYHLGKDRIFGACACKPRGICVAGQRSGDYSVRTARDKAGLSYAASAIDLGKLGGTLKGLRDFSVWLVEQARSNKPGTSDLREIIYTPDGVNVWRWDRERGYWSSPRTGEADDSHLSHTHISYYRDSEDRDKVALFARYFAAPPDTGTEGSDVRFTIPEGGFGRHGTVTATKDANLVRWDGTRVPIKAGFSRKGIPVEIGADNRPAYLVRFDGGEGHFILATAASFVPDAEPDVKQPVVLSVGGKRVYSGEA